MKKGFTLVELMMVMVLVGILVAVALPKYNASLERSRALEGITALKDVSDYLNTHYVMNGNQYENVSIGDIEKKIDTFQLRNFGITDISIENSTSPKTATVEMTREDTKGWDYSLVAINENGVLKKIRCDGYAPDCQAAGMKQVGNEMILDVM